MIDAVTTTSGDVFTTVETVDLARLILKRFGHDIKAATAAWCRLLENNCSEEQFVEIVDYPEHTPHCEGHCQHRED